MKLNIKVRYIHSDVITMERVEILQELRSGVIDVLVGVNLLREGLDLPEVSLVAILDADKEGFLRSERSLTQTAGRAARNINSRVILYADKMTESMKRMTSEANRRREKQMAYNEKHNITPVQITKDMRKVFDQRTKEDKPDTGHPYIEKENLDHAADPLIAYLPKDKIQKLIRETAKAMEEAVKQLDFLEAARFRDELAALKKALPDTENQ